MSKPPSPVRSAPVNAGAEQQAQELLAQEKWRAARDFLKPLVKNDRERFLPLLIRANIGLARKMMAAGQVSDARQVLSFLATIAPAQQLRALELEFAGKAGSAEQSLPKIIAALCDTGGSPLSEAERVQFTDMAVLTFQSAPLSGLTPEQVRLAAELNTLFDALRAASQAQWPVVSDLLRTVPHRSQLTHWVMFVKGLVAFYADEWDKAEKLWSSLPLNSVPAKASQAYLLVAGRLPASGAGRPLAQPVFEGACRIAGVGQGVEPLVAADALWRTGNKGESYRLMRGKVPDFPSRGLDWMGAVSEFYFKAPNQMAFDERDGYLRFFDAILANNTYKNKDEKIEAYRMFSLCNSNSDCSDAEGLRYDWELFIENYTEKYGLKPRWASLAFGWLGEKLSIVRADHGLGKNRQKLCDPEGAIKALRRSIELDRTNLDAHLQLCRVYESQNQVSDRNRLLDKMTAQFPDEQKVLVYAAERCIGRKAFNKGLDYLTRALQLDQLDPTIPALAAHALRQWARQHFQQHQPDKARAKLSEAERFCTDAPDDFKRARWTAFIHRGVMEQIWGEVHQADSYLSRGRDLAPSLSAYQFFAHLADRVYGNKRQCDSPFIRDFVNTSRTTFTVGEAARLLRILAHWKDELNELSTDDEKRVIAGSLESAAKRPFTRAEAVDVVTGAAYYDGFSNPMRAVIDKVLQGDPLDPRFKVWEFQLNHGPTEDLSIYRPQVQSILDEATRRGDEGAKREARKILEVIDDPDSDELDSFDPDEEDFDEDDLDEEADDAFPGLDKVMDILANTSNSDLKELRRTMVPLIGEAAFDAMVNAAKEGHPSPSFSSPPRKSGKALKPTSPQSDPTQLDLF